MQGTMREGKAPPAPSSPFKLGSVGYSEDQTSQNYQKKSIKTKHKWLLSATYKSETVSTLAYV